MNGSMKARVAARVTIEIIAGIAEKAPDIWAYFHAKGADKKEKDTDRAIMLSAEGKDREATLVMLEDKGIPFVEADDLRTDSDIGQGLKGILIPISFEKELQELLLLRSDSREEIDEEYEPEVQTSSEDDPDANKENRDVPDEEEDEEEDDSPEDVMTEPRNKKKSDMARRRHISFVPDSRQAETAKRPAANIIRGNRPGYDEVVTSQVIGIGTAESLTAYSDDQSQNRSSAKINVHGETVDSTEPNYMQSRNADNDKADTNPSCHGKEDRANDQRPDNAYKIRSITHPGNPECAYIRKTVAFPIEDKASYTPPRAVARDFVNKDTIEEWRRKRFYEVKTEASSAHFQRAGRNIEMIAGEVLAPRDTAGGKGMHQVLNVARPVTAYLHAKYIQHGIVAFNQEIRFDKEVYAAAYATAKGVKREGSIRLDTKGLPAYPIEHARMDVQKLLDGMCDAGAMPNIDMARFNKYAKESNAKSFAEMIRGFSKEQLYAFARAAGLSDEMVRCISGLPEYTEFDTKILKQLSSAATDPKDKAFVEMFRGSNLFDRMGASPVRMAVKTFSRRLMYRTVGDSPGSRGISTVNSLGRSISTVYKAGLKGTERIAKRLGANERTMEVIRYARTPVRHTYRTVMKSKRAASKIQGINRRVTSKIAKMQERLTAKMAGKVSAEVGKAAIEKTAVTAAAEGTAAGTGAAGASAAGTGASGASAGAAAGGISAGGIVAIIIIAIIVIIGVIAKIQNDHANEERVSLMRTGNWAENTEIVDELISEFEAMNTEFNRQINDARFHRGTFSMNTNYEGGQTATEYESYHVVFRDGYGNELEPETVDFNNTKAIIAMASSYFPYPFQNHAQGDAETKEYEEIKQYFKDYCHFLWASTHRISIEEYYPGDMDYEEYGDTNLATYQGKCDADGQTIWMPENLSPNIIYMNETSDEEECPLCTPDFVTDQDMLAKALCTHPYETYAATDGWRKTGNVQSHIHCPGHRVTDYGTDENGNRIVDGYHYEYCEEGSIRSKTHVHTSYEWEYVCGGHMSAVVYVTVGDLSRISSMPAAKDVDYGTVGSYKEE